MSDTPVIFSKEDSIASIVMNSPKTLNAIGFPMLDGLEAALEKCFDKDIRAVVISAAGPAFCAGGDLPVAMEYGPSEWLLQSVKKMNVIASLIRNLPKPVIASIHGHCFGVGMSLTMLCDIRIAAESTLFKQAYTSIGLSPDGGWSFTVPRLIGAAKALELVMLDPIIPASEALRLGLVNKVVPDEALLEETMKLARRLARGATRAYAAAKALINSSVYEGLESQCEKERWSIASCGATEDFKEGFDAVFNKRKPNFKGK